MGKNTWIELEWKGLENMVGAVDKWAGKIELSWSQKERNFQKEVQSNGLENLDGDGVKWAGIFWMQVSWGQKGLNFQFKWACSQMGWTNGLEYLY